MFRPPPQSGIQYPAFGMFTSTPELEAAINEYIAMHNAKPKPFIWNAKATILAKVTRARPVLNKNTSN